MRHFFAFHFSWTILAQQQDLWDNMFLVLLFLYMPMVWLEKNDDFFYQIELYQLELYISSQS